MSRLFTPCTNEQVVSLITRAFDADGMLVSNGKRKNQKEARAILDSGVNVYNTYVNGCDAHDCLLIIAYPNRTL